MSGHFAKTYRHFFPKKQQNVRTNTAIFLPKKNIDKHTVTHVGLFSLYLLNHSFRLKFPEFLESRTCAKPLNMHLDFYTLV